jgi:hypothetical protein
MSDTTIIEAMPAAGSGQTPFSWSAAIAGAIAAAAVTFIIAALGSGIGLPFASPYSSSLSATSLTVAAAVWLVMAQAIGFAAGGYLAGRLRSPLFDGAVGERTFRDAAQGFMVWAIGVFVTVSIAGLIGLYGAGTTAQVAAGLAAGFATNPASESTGRASTAPAVDYFVDAMFRPAPGNAVANGQQRSAGETVGSAAPPPARAQWRDTRRSLPHHDAQHRPGTARPGRQGLSGAARLRPYRAAAGRGGAPRDRHRK